MNPLHTLHTLHEASVPRDLSAKKGRGVTPGASMQALTPRQLEVLSLMAQGYSNPDIAESLGLSCKTVENYINCMYSELELFKGNHVVPRVQAVLNYIDYTLLFGRQPTPSIDR